MRPSGAPALLTRLLLPAAACFLGVLLGRFLPSAGEGPRAETPANHVSGVGGAPTIIATTTTTTTTADAEGVVGHMRAPRSAAELAAVPGARRLGDGDPRLERALLTAGSLPHLSAGVEVVAAAAAIPPHAHEVGEVLFFWRGAGGATVGTVPESSSATAVAIVGGQVIALADGDVLVIPAGKVHTVMAAAVSELWLVWVLGEQDFDFRSTYDAQRGADVYQA